MTNRLLSLFIILILTMTFAVPLCGTADVVSDIAAVGLSTSSNYVIVYPDKVVVTSHPTNTSYQLNSDEVISALSSNNGYTLSYVDEDKNVPSSPAEHVRTGYIRCEKQDAATIDIPVTDRGTLMYPSGSFMETAPGTIVRQKDITQVAGKNSDDASYVVRATDADITKFWRLDFALSGVTKDAGESNANDGTVPNETFTIESNVYIDGNIGMAAYIRAYKLCEVDSSGNIYAINKGSGLNGTEWSATDFNNNKENLGKIETGKWHRFAFGYDITTQQVYIYVDGNLITDKGSKNLTNYTVIDTFRFGPANGNGITGTLAVDDVVAYEGYYYPQRNVVKVNDVNTESLIIDSTQKTIKYDSDAYATDTALKADVFAASPSEPRLAFLKSDFSVVSTARDACYCMLESLCDGVYIYDYYLMEKFFEIKDFEFTGDSSDTVGAKASVASSLSEEKCATMVMVILNTDGIVEKVVSSDTVSVSMSTEAKALEITPQELSDGQTVKVIFIDKWDSRLIIQGGIYTK